MEVIVEARYGFNFDAAFAVIACTSSVIITSFAFLLRSHYRVSILLLDENQEEINCTKVAVRNKRDIGILGLYLAVEQEISVRVSE